MNQEADSDLTHEPNRSECEDRASLRVSDFDFYLPEELIAQQPPAERGQSRMLVIDRASGALRDATFSEFPVSPAPR